MMSPVKKEQANVIQYSAADLKMVGSLGFFATQNQTSIAQPLIPVKIKMSVRRPGFIVCKVHLRKRIGYTQYSIFLTHKLSALEA